MTEKIAAVEFMELAWGKPLNPWQVRAVEQIATMTPEEIQRHHAVMRDLPRLMQVKIDRLAADMFGRQPVPEPTRDPREPFPGIRIYGP